MNEFELKIFENQWQRLNIINVLNTKDKNFPDEITSTIIYKYKDYICLTALVTKASLNVGYEDRVKMIHQLIKDNNEYVDIILYDKQIDSYLMDNQLEDNMFVFMDGLIDSLAELEFMPKPKKGYENNLGKQIDRMIIKQNISPKETYEQILKKYKIDIDKIEQWAQNEKNEKGKRGL